ncbi:antibiotic biosynthesis monooxygenase family protein [Roseibium sediminicola]|uniref:Antibiotic biosynthesis monooxygenase n=1 Tax=Roseibium sediminicola TaxID=2933272 RepID=A0ABT0GSP2_9HYPH|nr:antibiotic biosynthesis monooxygenase family protein [Roseibium sp. CAU 1639]MCK7612455.1 antibiotic biosynthesis monooxygenase [Roseibium sp. CAU 1639]
MSNTVFHRCRNVFLAAILIATTGTTAMATDPAAGKPVTLINVFEIPEGQLDQTIAFWEKARNFLKKQPGFLDTSLHQSLSPDARFQLVNVARWQSPAAFQAAIEKMQKSDLGGGMRGAVFHAALYRVIRTEEDR